MTLDTNKIRRDFPIFKRTINGYPLTYLDNAATSQKPQIVIDTISDFYQNHNANIHRAIHTLGEEATTFYENARKKVAEFINAKSEREIIFTSGTTASLNLLAYSWGRNNINAGKEIILTVMEHHSNLVPWQQLAAENGAILKYWEITDNGVLDVSALKKMITKNTALLTLTHVSNVLGTINPVREIIKIARQYGLTTIVDAAQSVPHMAVDVQNLDCDFLAFSGHKMLGPTGVGVLYGKEKLLEELPPFLFGGSMISEVHLDKTIFSGLPAKFEAGTAPIAQAIGLGAAVDYLTKTGMSDIRTHEIELTEYALKQFKTMPEITVYGPKETGNRGGVISFNLKGVHPHDVAQILDNQGIAIRVGHHCAMPLHERLKIPASCRASFYLYNTNQDIDRLINALGHVKKIFRI